MTEPEIRPEVVDAVLKALTNMDPSALDPVKAGGLTAAEKAAADNLFLQQLVAGQDNGRRRLEAWQVFIDAGMNAQLKQTWGDLFDLLSDDQVTQLRDLYDVLEDGARIEFDARYGRPLL